MKEALPMTELTLVPPEPKGHKPGGATPYKANGARFIGKAIDAAMLTARQEPEPEIQKGLDLAGRTKIVFAAGRGKTGKTTLLRWITEMSILNGGTPILADVDPSNAAFSRYFADVARPDTDTPAGVVTWLQDLIEHCIVEKQSAIIDLGGGDTTLRTLATEMPGLTEQIEAAGLSPVMFHLVGTQPEDLEPATTLAMRGFAPKAQALVFNEFSIESGLTRDRAFGRIIGAPSYGTLAKASLRLWMPRLASADAVESRQCTYLAARDGAIDPPLGIFEAARVRAWLNMMDRRFAGVGSWIP
jgi:hypothetical protein